MCVWAWYRVYTVKETHSSPQRTTAKFRYGEHGEYLVTARELEELRRLEKRYLRGKIRYQVYLAKRRSLLTLEQTGRPARRKVSKNDATPWTKIKIFGGGLPELGKR